MEKSINNNATETANLVNLDTNNNPTSNSPQLLDVTATNSTINNSQNVANLSITIPDENKKIIQEMGNNLSHLSPDIDVQDEQIEQQITILENQNDVISTQPEYENYSLPINLEHIMYQNFINLTGKNQETLDNKVIEVYNCDTGERYVCDYLMDIVCSTIKLSLTLYHSYKSSCKYLIKNFFYNSNFEVKSVAIIKNVKGIFIQDCYLKNYDDELYFIVGNQNKEIMLEAHSIISVMFCIQKGGKDICKCISDGNKKCSCKESVSLCSDDVLSVDDTTDYEIGIENWPCLPCRHPDQEKKHMYL